MRFDALEHQSTSAKCSTFALNTNIDGFLWLFGMFYNIFLGNLAAVVE